ncbi:hypothetical protein [Sodalis sp.]|uniref:hypothetical protein n=1 Tax=Sodalis sp. (in: enterobacteria) TaxID=1898979 RepID=UPI003873257B
MNIKEYYPDDRACRTSQGLPEVFLVIFIGEVTFTGSIVAFGKLHGKIFRPRCYRSAIK